MPAIKLRQVLTHDITADGSAVFGDDGGSGRSVLVSLADWHDMGSPLEVTVTVRPGDRLN